MNGYSCCFWDNIFYSLFECFSNKLYINTIYCKYLCKELYKYHWWYNSTWLNNMCEKFNCHYITPQLAHHRCVNVKSGTNVVLLTIFLNKATSYCFVSLNPIFTIFSIQVGNDIGKLRSSAFSRGVWYCDM